MNLVLLKLVDDVQVFTSISSPPDLRKWNKNTNDLYMPCANYNAYNKSENAWVNHLFNVKSYFETDKKL